MFHRLTPLLHGVACVGLALFFFAILFWFWLQGTSLGGPLSWCFDHYCHRLAERSLWAFGAPLPVCARCTGVAAGYFLGAIVALCGGEKLFFWRLPWALFFIALMGLSWFAGVLQFVPPEWSYERVLFGLFGGFGGYIFIARSIVLLVEFCLKRQ